MMGHREKLIDGLEVDYIFARNMYCYLVNNPKLKKYTKRKISKRIRRNGKQDLRNEM
jgi:hypothetical protein